MNRFEINDRGFAELQKGRPKWSFVRELVSNAFDEDITRCDVTLEKNGRKAAVITVEDDGAGFRDIKDAYVLFGATPKRANPEVRGRFNLGEKEFASIAKSMRIETTTGGIYFPPGGGRKRINKRRANGTLVTVEVNWGKADLAEIKERLLLFIPPEGKRLYINGSLVNRPLIKIAAARVYLPTVRFDGTVMKESSRMTDIMVYRAPGGKGWLYELGIPVQRIDCPYLADVQQKIPLSPNRESVKDSYLNVVYAEVLDEVVDELTETGVSENWVRKGTENYHSDDETIKKVKDLRYGNAVLWSSDTAANERAQAAGLEVVHPKTLSHTERVRFKEVGLVSAKEQFGLAPNNAPEIPPGKWDRDMRCLAKLAGWMSVRLQGKNLAVQYYQDKRIAAAANFGDGTMYFNLAHFRIRFPATPRMVGVILHELAHRKGNGHLDIDYVDELGRLSGRAVMLALDDPEEFNRKIGGQNESQA